MVDLIAEVKLSAGAIKNMDMHQIYELWRKESTKAWREVRKQLKKIKEG